MTGWIHIAVWAAVIGDLQLLERFVGHAVAEEDARALDIGNVTFAGEDEGSEEDDDQT